jgi:hypothetical protein
MDLIKFQNFVHPIKLVIRKYVSGFEARMNIIVETYSEGLRVRLVEKVRQTSVCFLCVLTSFIFGP